MIDFLYSKNKIKAKLYTHMKIQKIEIKKIHTLENRRKNYHSPENQRNFRDSRLKGSGVFTRTGKRNTGYVSNVSNIDNDYSFPWPQQERDNKIINHLLFDKFEVIYFFNKVKIYEKEFDAIEKVVNYKLSKYTNVILTFKKVSNDFYQSRPAFNYKIFQKLNINLINDNIFNTLILISNIIEQIPICFDFYYNILEYKEIKIGEPQINEILNIYFYIRLKNIHFLI